MTIPDPALLWLVAALALGAYGMRVAGYLAAGFLGLGPRGVAYVRLATGNLLVAVAAVGIAQMGWPALAGTAATVAAMRGCGREWAALPLGAAAAAIVTSLAS